MNFQNESKLSMPNPSIIEIVKLYIARLKEKGLDLSKVILYDIIKLILVQEYFLCRENS